MKASIIQGMCAYQQDYRAWTGHYWECTSCETFPLCGPFEDSGLCEKCAMALYEGAK